MLIIGYLPRFSNYDLVPNFPFKLNLLASLVDFNFKMRAASLILLFIALSRLAPFSFILARSPALPPSRDWTLGRLWLG
jgi:hypothetical protein